ncbi:tetraspanin-10 isoform X3 [Cicer arietinum]|uniref:tetraspanin-10 isoform X3 n=1 Tax=Cicer arietinum TaxID=3827 RepID=UPI003CC61C91
MGMGTSTFVTRWINFLTMVLAMVVIIFGVWMSTRHDACRKSLTIPVLSIGGVIFLISVVGFLGAVKRSSILLWLYLIMLFFILVGILVFTVLVFIVTNNGSGHSVTGLRYKEYQLQDYSSWFLKELNNSHNWERLRVCLVKTEGCNNLSKKYKTYKQYKLAKLTPIEAGCCRPPSDLLYTLWDAVRDEMRLGANLRVEGNGKHPQNSFEICLKRKTNRDQCLQLSFRIPECDDDLYILPDHQILLEWVIY